MGKRKRDSDQKKRKHPKHREPKYAGLGPTIAARAAFLKEKKGVDTSVDSSGNVLATTNSNSQIIPVNLVRAGANSWERVGRKVQLKSLRVGGVVRFTWKGASSTCHGESFRLVVVFDAQPSSGTVPTWDTIFGTTTQAGTEASAYNVPPRYDNMQRFRVLRDVTVDMWPQFNYYSLTACTGDYVKAFNEYIKLDGLETVFSGQSAPMTISDLSTGALYVGYRATANVSTGGEGDRSFDVENSYARLRYTD